MKRKNRKGFVTFFVLCIVLGGLSCMAGVSNTTKKAVTKPKTNSTQSLIDVNIKVNNKTFKAKFYDNASTQVLLKKMPFTISMDDYSSQEKVADLDYIFPKANTSKPETIKAGELYLWSGNRLVLFYTTFRNSYGGYVPIGYIEDVKGLTKALGTGDINITFEKMGAKK